MNHGNTGWIEECMEWVDESGWQAGLNRLSWERGEQEALNQSMSPARWVQAYLEWTYEESGNVLHVAYIERRNFDRRTAIQLFCDYARRASDRQAHTRPAVDWQKSALPMRESLAA